VKVLNDFKCPAGHEIELLVPKETSVVECKVCGLLSTKVRAVPQFMLESASGSFPGATLKWAKDREKRLKAEQREVARHGEQS